jgi:hypothetical protein
MKEPPTEPAFLGSFMLTWLVYLTRVAIGCATTIISFVSMVLLANLAEYISNGGSLESDYNSSPPAGFLVLLALPLFFIASILVGTFVTFRVKPLPVPPTKNRNRPVPDSN